MPKKKVGIHETVELQPIVEDVLAVHPELVRIPVIIPPTLHKDLDTPPQNATTEKHDEMNSLVQKAHDDAPKIAALPKFVGSVRIRALPAFVT